MRKSITRRKVIAGVATTSVALALPVAAFAAPNVHEILIKSFAFVPDNLSVRLGDIIKWTNEDLAPHTATASDLTWDTGALDRHESTEFVVIAKMDSEYFCAFHPHMKGKIVLE